MNRILLLSCFALAVSVASLVFVATRQPTEAHANTSIEVTVSEVQEAEDAVEQLVKELRQDDRTTDDWWPTWDADPLVYIIVDKDDRTADRWVSEWTPYGHKGMRCVLYNGGGIACFNRGISRDIDQK